MLLLLLLPLLAADRARAACCKVVDTGVLQGEVGVHMETLRPDQRALRVTVPLVCAEQNGMRAVACETATLSVVEAIDAMEVAEAADAVKAAEATDPGEVAEQEASPLLELDGRTVIVTRSAAVAPEGFAVLSIEVYCKIPAGQND